MNNADITQPTGTTAPGYVKAWLYGNCLLRYVLCSAEREVVDGFCADLADELKGFNPAYRWCMALHLAPNVLVTPYLLDHLRRLARTRPDVRGASIVISADPVVRQIAWYMLASVPKAYRVRGVFASEGAGLAWLCEHVKVKMNTAKPAQPHGVACP